MDRTNREKRFIHIIQGSMEELFTLKMECDDLDPGLRHYLDLMSAYLQADFTGMKRVITELESGAGASPEGKLLHAIALVRLAIREQKVQRESLDEIQRMVADPALSMWRGEVHFVVSMAMDTLKDYTGMLYYSKFAAQELRRIGAPKKAVMALLNCVVAESNLRPDKKLIPDYYFVAKHALKLRAHDTAAICFENIAHEYQKMGAYNTALKFVNRAIALLDRCVGGYNYFLAIANRCHLLIELGQGYAARADLEVLENSNFPEIRASIDFLKALLNKSERKTDDSQASTAPWKQRLEAELSGKKGLKLGALEEKLLSLLTKSAADKFELIEHLYGSQVDFFTAENRLKNLMNRVRKRFPGLIVLTKDKYRLAEEGLNVEEIVGKVS